MLTEQELALVNKLGECFKDFEQLTEQHPRDREEFMHGIHQCQNIIMAHSAVRSHPEVFVNLTEG